MDATAFTPLGNWTLEFMKIRINSVVLGARTDRVKVGGQGFIFFSNGAGSY